MQGQSHSFSTARLIRTGSILHTPDWPELQYCILGGPTSFQDYLRILRIMQAKRKPFPNSSPTHRCAWHQLCALDCHQFAFRWHVLLLLSSGLPPSANPWRTNFAGVIFQRRMTLISQRHIALGVPQWVLSACSFIFKDFIFPFSPQSLPVHSCVFLLLDPSIVACGMLPQHGLMSGAMSAPRIWTGETLGPRSGGHELNHWATELAPANFLTGWKSWIPRNWEFQRLYPMKQIITKKNEIRYWLSCITKFMKSWLILKSVYV